MVQTRKQANAEAQAAGPATPAPTVDPAPTTPAAVAPKKGGAKNASPKKATLAKVIPDKTTPTKATTKNTTSRSRTKDTITTSSNGAESEEGHTAGDGAAAEKPNAPAIKKGRVNKTPQNIIEAPLNRNGSVDVDTTHTEPAKTKGKATLKAKRKKRGTGNNTSENDNPSDEPQRKRATAKAPMKPPSGNRSTDNETDPDGTDKSESYEQNWADYKQRQQNLAAMKRKAPATDPGENHQSAEPPRKKTKRFKTRNAATGKDGTDGEPRKGVPTDGPTKKAAAATKKAAKAPKPRTKHIVGTRRSARISGNPVISSSGDEDVVGRPLKDRFKKRVKTPEIPDNKIGLDENEIFEPRFPIDGPRPANATMRTRTGGGFSTKAQQRTLTGEANRRTLSAWERTTIEGLTARLIVPTESGSGNRPFLVDESVQMRFQRRSLDSSGHGITELGTEDSKAQVPTLTNAIHPIWAFRNFTFSGEPSKKHRIQNERAYEAIAPALRLASHWIEEPEFEEFWHTLWSGGLSHNEKTGAVTIPARGPGGVYGKTPFHELKIVRYKGPAQEETAILMQELAELESLEWRFEPTAVKYVGLSTTTGQVSTLHDWFERDILYDSDSPPLSTRTTSERLRVLFLFAVHLCRQLVQQVYHHNWAQFSQDTPPPHISKVLFETSPGTFDYLEVSWDTFMFTGSIVKVNPHKLVHVDCPDGLAIALGRRAAEWRDSASPKTFAALPMRWINDLFQDEFWSQKGRGTYYPRLPDGHPPCCALGPFT